MLEYDSTSKCGDFQRVENSQDEVYCPDIIDLIFKENDATDSVAYIFVTVLGQPSNSNFVWQNMQNYDDDDCVCEVFR